MLKNDSENRISPNELHSERSWLCGLEERDIHISMEPESSKRLTRMCPHDFRGKYKSVQWKKGSFLSKWP